MSKEYRVVVPVCDFNLNKLLAGRIYNHRTKKYHNPVKASYDKICCLAIRKHLRNLHIDNKIDIHYKFYCKDKRQDKMNIFSAFDKAFEDALQLCKVIKNDGWEEIGDISHNFFVDKYNPRVEVIIMEANNE